MTVIQELDRDGNGELDFDEFVQMLKDASMRFSKDNYLKDRNLLYQRQNKDLEQRENFKKRGKYLPQLRNEVSQDVFQEYNIEKYQKELRNRHDKNLDMKEKDPKELERKKAVLEQLNQKKKVSYTFGS